MSDGQKLFLILSVLYLYDCLVWMGRRTVLFSAAWMNRWRAKFATDFYFGNNSGAIGMANPLPFFGANYLAHWAPISISPEGVCSYATHALPGRDDRAGMVVRFDEITQSGTEGKHLVLNGSRFATCGSEHEARSYLELIRRVAESGEKEREKVIRKALATRYNKTKAERRMRLIKRRADRLRWIGSGLFGFVYIAAPTAAWFCGVTNVVIPAGIVMFVTAWIISFIYFRADKALHPERSERIPNTAQMTLCPPAAIRASDFLTLHALEKFHPVVLADLFLGADAPSFAQTVVRNLKYSARNDIEDPAAQAVIAWHRDLELEMCLKFAGDEYSLEIEDLLVAPEWDGASAAYCPHCLNQFPEGGECIDCPGVELIPFSTDQKTEAIHES